MNPLMHLLTNGTVMYSALVGAISMWVTIRFHVVSVPIRSMFVKLQYFHMYIPTDLHSGLA